MNFEIAKGIDEELYMLAQRKKMLDRRIEQRQATMADFSVAHHKSVEQVHEKLRQQNIAARARNRKFFEEVNYATGSLHDLRSRHGSHTETKASRELEQARLSYLKFTEKLLPSYREKQAMQQLGALHQMKLEKEQAELRRQSALREMERQHQLQCAVEQERRELMLSLALEERDKLAAAAEQRILQAQGRAVDQVIQQEFETFGDEYASHVNRASRSGVERAQPVVEKHFASNRLPPSDSLPMSQPRDITTSAAESLAGLSTLRRSSGDYGQSAKYMLPQSQPQPHFQPESIAPRPEQQRLSPQQSHRSHLQQQVMPTVVATSQPTMSAMKTKPSYDGKPPANFEDFIAKSDCLSPAASHATLLQSRDLEGDLARFVPGLQSQVGVNEDTASPRKESLQNSPVKPSTTPSATVTANDESSGGVSTSPVKKTSEHATNEKGSEDNVLNISVENRRRPSAALPPKPPPVKHGSTESLEEGVVGLDDDSVVVTKQPTTSPSKTERDEISSRVVGSMDGGEESDGFSTREGTVQRSASGAISESLGSDEVKESTDEGNNEEKSAMNRASAVSTPTNASIGSSKELSIDNDSVLSTPSKSNNDIALESTSFALTPSMALKSLSQKPKPSDDVENSTDSVSSLLQSPHTAPPTKLTEACTPPQVLQLLQKVCTNIETFTEPLAVRKGYGVAASSTASSVHSTSVSAGVGLDRQRRLMNAMLASRDHEVATFQVEVACALLLRVISEYGGYILPGEEFNGLMTVEKVAKIHKKLGGGRADMWGAIVAHMTAMIDLKRMPMEEFAKLVTQAFIAQVDESERSRFERKVLKTLQLAIIPKDKENPSPAGTPLKPAQRTPLKSSLATDLAPTPPMSPSASLEDSSGKIGNIFGGGGQQKFLSQRAAEKERESKSKAAPSKMSAGIAIGSAGNMVLNRIQNLSNFDDDEIEEDEVIGQPPALRDLSQGQDNLNASDEFDF